MRKLVFVFGFTVLMLIGVVLLGLVPLGFSAGPLQLMWILFGPVLIYRSKWNPWRKTV